MTSPPIRPLALSRTVENDPEVRARATMRLRLVSRVLLGMLVVVGLRGAQLGVLPSERTLRAASILRWNTEMVQAPRGEIVDRRGRRLAVSVPTARVVVDPSMVDETTVGELSAELAEILDIEQGTVAAKLRRRPSRYQRLRDRVHPAAAAKVEALRRLQDEHGKPRFPGLMIEEEPMRFYPEEALAAQVLGFVDASGTGREGLEAAYESHLRGGVILRQRRRDRRGLSVDEPSGRAGSHAGMTVHLALDRTVQRATERALRDAMERSAPKAAMAVVVEVQTGDLLALATLPSFDPNVVRGPARNRRNQVVEFPIEPGSVFKPFTVAAALEERRVRPTSVIDCSGPLVVSGAEIRDTHPRDRCTVAEVIQVSSNVGAARLALDLGAERFLTYVSAFGFGEPTRVGLPAESGGTVRRIGEVRPVELATTAFGQGVSVTPLQLAMAVAALGNDGVLMRPRLVTRVVDAHGVPEQVHPPRSLRRVVSASTAAEVVRMMVAVTAPGGTAPDVAVPGFVLASKTGTAEKPLRNGRGYGSGRIASFVTLVPAEEPAIAVVVVIDEPSRGSHYGGVAAGPVAATIASDTLRLLGIPRQLARATETRPVPSFP